MTNPLKINNIFSGGDAVSIQDASELFELLDRNSAMPEDADFCLTLSDDAMAPFFPAGADVYVSATRAPEEFEAGIFLCEGRVLCRQWCEDFSGTLHLLPANSALKKESIAVPKRLRDKCLCLGSVISGKKLPRPE